MSHENVGEVIKALNASVISAENLIAIALDKDTQGKQEEVESILLALLTSKDSGLLTTKQHYAQLILASVQRYLRENKVFRTYLINETFNILEAVADAKQPQAVRQTLADVKSRYIAQVLIINEIFQQAMNIIYTNPDISYDELYNILLVNGALGEKFSQLTMNQRVLIKSLLIYSRVDRLILKQKFEEARHQYPIDEFSAVSKQLMHLYQQRKKYAREKNSAEIRKINEQISSLRQKLSDLRNSIIPYLEGCGVAAQDAPEVAIIELGPFRSRNTGRF